MNIYLDNSFTIGNTPIIKFNKLGNGKIFAKIESRNPSFSVKCRIGANMILNGIKNNKIKPGIELLEATSGNTGIALAYIAANKNYPLTLMMPENMSNERKKLLKALGAKLILTNKDKGILNTIKETNKLYNKYPKKYYFLQQFNNLANPEIHEKTTGPEIWKDTKGKIDILIAGVGTGGTITGIGNFFKKKNKKIIIIAVEPKESPMISNQLNKKKQIHKKHFIQGIGAGFIPNILNINLIDIIITINSIEAIKMAKKLMLKEGILAGISSGAATAAAIKLLKNKIYSKKNIVIILPSASERYISTNLFAKY